jgi:hypothetical protein
MPKFNVQYKKEFTTSHNEAVLNIEADNASAALLSGAKALGFDIDPLTQTYTLVLEAKPVISLNPPIDMIVDEYGSIDAEIKRLTKQKESLSVQIKESGAGRYTASIYEALVFDVKPRVTVDWETIALKFNPSHQLITAHTKTGEASLSLKVTKA